MGAGCERCCRRCASWAFREDDAAEERRRKELSIGAVVTFF
eukprot:gene21592-8191_t